MPFLEKSKRETPSGSGGSHLFGLDQVGAWGREEYTPSSVAKAVVRSAPLPGVDRLTCANPECRGGWKLPWRNRRRPIFEDRWACSASCLQSIVRRALRRERGDLRIELDGDTPHRHRVPLGLVMLGQGLITQRQLRAALDAQRAAGEGRIGDLLMQECGLSAAQITRGLAAQWSCPVLPIDGFSPAAMSLVMPRLLVEELGLLPIRVAGSRILYVAFKDRLEASAAFALEQMNGLDVVSGLIEDSLFDAARRRLLESTFVQVDRQIVLDVDTLADRIAGILERVQVIGSRVVRVGQHYWLRTWLEQGSYSGVGRLPATGEDVRDTVFTISS